MDEIRKAFPIPMGPPGATVSSLFIHNMFLPVASIAHKYSLLLLHSIIHMLPA